MSEFRGQFPLSAVSYVELVNKQTFSITTPGHGTLKLVSPNQFVLGAWVNSVNRAIFVLRFEATDESPVIPDSLFITPISTTSKNNTEDTSGSNAEVLESIKKNLETCEFDELFSGENCLQLPILPPLRPEWKPRSPTVDLVDMDAVEDAESFEQSEFPIDHDQERQDTAEDVAASGDNIDSARMVASTSCPESERCQSSAPPEKGSKRIPNVTPSTSTPISSNKSTLSRRTAARDEEERWWSGVAMVAGSKPIQPPPSMKNLRPEISGNEDAGVDKADGNVDPSLAAWHTWPWIRTRSLGTPSRPILSAVLQLCRFEHATRQFRRRSVAWIINCEKSDDESSISAPQHVLALQTVFVVTVFPIGLIWPSIALSATYLKWRQYLPTSIWPTSRLFVNGSLAKYQRHGWLYNNDDVDTSTVGTSIDGPATKQEICKLCTEGKMSTALLWLASEGAAMGIVTVILPMIMRPAALLLPLALFDCVVTLSKLCRCIAQSNVVSPAAKSSARRINEIAVQVTDKLWAKLRLGAVAQGTVVRTSIISVIIGGIIRLLIGANSAWAFGTFLVGLAVSSTP